MARTRNEILTHMAILLVMKMGIESAGGRHMKSHVAALDYAMELMAREIEILEASGDGNGEPG